MEADQSGSLGDGEVPLGLTPELSRFIENMGLYYEDYGIARIGGRILGLLLVAQKPLAPEQIAATLKVSRSSISTNIRYLVMSNMVEKVSVPGDRCDYFIFSPEGWQSAFQERLAGLEPLRELAAEGMAAMPQDHPARRNLEELSEWVTLAEKTYHQFLVEWQSRRNRMAA